MTGEVQHLIARLHAAPYRAVLALAGGGTTAAAWLLAVPGASRTVLEVNVPYDGQALDAYLGRAPASYCSAETAVWMAQRSRERAGWLDSQAATVGLGCTASLRSDRPKKGEHRVHVAVAAAGGVQTYSLNLTKDARDREGEEEVASRLVLMALASAFGVACELPLGLREGEQVETAAGSSGPLGRLLAGEIESLCVEPDGRLHADGAMPAFLLPGSFNPLHMGHRGLFETAGRRVGGAGAYELSVVNVEKPALGEAEVRERLRAFAWHRPVWLTRAPTFAEKARLFPGVVFVVGADTALRIVQPRFYGGSAEAMRAALASIAAAGCRFLVAGRVDERGTFIDRERAELGEEFAGLFEWLTEGEFRHDVSSTALRMG